MGKHFNSLLVCNDPEKWELVEWKVEEEFFTEDIKGAVDWEVTSIGKEEETVVHALLEVPVVRTSDC